MPTIRGARREAETVMPAKAGIQYAAASAICAMTAAEYWIARSEPGDDDWDLAPLFLRPERDPRVLFQPLDQFVAHRRTWRPDSRCNVRRIAQQADRAFRDHL